MRAHLSTATAAVALLAAMPAQSRKRPGCSIPAQEFEYFCELDAGDAANGQAFFSRRTLRL